jgi:hypothetical protein
LVEALKLLGLVSESLTSLLLETLLLLEVRLLLLLLLLLLAGLFPLLLGLAVSLLMSSFLLLEGKLLAAELLLLNLLLANPLSAAVPVGPAALVKCDEEERRELKDKNAKLDERGLEEKEDSELAGEDCAEVDTGRLVVSDGMALEIAEDVPTEVI